MTCPLGLWPWFDGAGLLSFEAADVPTGSLIKRGPGLMAGCKPGECHQMRAVDDLPPGFVALV